MAVSGIIAVASASATGTVYHVSERRWVSNNGPNSPFSTNELIQYSDVISAGWNSYADFTIRSNWNIWDYLSNYRIDAWVLGQGVQITSTVGDTYTTNPSLLEMTQLVTWGFSYTETYPVSGRLIYPIYSSGTIFNERKYFKTGTGQIQAPVRNWDGDIYPYLLDIVTRHEAGHIWGCARWVSNFSVDGHSSNPNDLMYGAYPNANGIMSVNDQDTIYYNYNVRQF